MYVGGAGLARGYLAAAGVDGGEIHSASVQRVGGARLYRTGDLARYGADGNMEYLGRVDQQVKVRGFRVELGEIEAVLQQHGGVRECAVLAVEKEAGEKQLVAYVVASGGTQCGEQ